MKTPEDKDPSLSKQNEQDALEEMSTIRNVHHEPDHHQQRLADFEQYEKTEQGFPLQAPIVKDGQQVYVNDTQIHTAQDLVDGLVSIYGEQPHLYGFEDNKRTDAKAKSGNEKQPVSFETAAHSVMTEIMEMREINELEEILKTMAKMETIDEAQLNEIGKRVIDLARKAGIDDLTKYGFDLDR